MTRISARRARMLVASAMLLLAACGDGEGGSRALVSGSPTPRISCPPSPELWDENVRSNWQMSTGDEEDFLEAYQVRHEDTFAGAWYDNRRRKYRVAFTRDLEQHARAFAQAGADMDVMEFCSARFTRREVTALKERISSEHLAERKDVAGSTVTFVAPDDITGLVEIGIDPFSAEAVEELERMYGADRIRVTRREPVEPATD